MRTIVIENNCLANTCDVRAANSIGWAISRDGVNFTKHVANPLASSAALSATGPNDGSRSRTRSTPRSAAMAEASIYIEAPFIYVHHTIRWCGGTACPMNSPTDPLAPQGRNAVSLNIKGCAVWYH